MHNPTLPPPTDDALVVLAVCPRGQVLQDVRALVAAWPVAACVRWTADPIDALRIALLDPPVLVIVDARLERSGGRALVGQLARWRADLEIIAFDDPPAEGLRAQPSLWHWSELPRVLRWWANRHLVQSPRAPLFGRTQENAAMIEPLFVPAVSLAAHAAATAPQTGQAAKR